MSQIRNTAASSHLDWIRGLAAFLVLIYHVRYRFFLDYADVTQPDIATVAFYAITSFGHDAVIVFFVLSGYFISSSVFSRVTAGRWSWSEYLSDRAIRLYVVLLPGLLLTGLWDWAGLEWFGEHPIYEGHAQTWRSDYFRVADRASPAIMLGNMAFLQTIYIPPYGSNDPLWSLAYEFWFYVLFPAALVAVWPGTSARQRLFAVALAILALTVMTRSMLLYFPIWLLGLGIALLPKIDCTGRRLTAGIAAFSALYVATVMATHVGAVKRLLGESALAIDYVNAAAFACLLWMLLHDRRTVRSEGYRFIGGHLAAMSYSLYVVHMPLLVFVRAALTPERPWHTSLANVLAALAITVVAVAYAWCVARMTEANTDSVKRWYKELLRRRSLEPVLDA